MKNWKPLLTLLLLATILPELATGSTQFTVFFNPGMFIWLLSAYGFAVLIIREVYVRWKLGLVGLFLLGLGYGIFNEGVVNDTLLRVTNVPIAAFNDYGHFLGIGFPWTLVILTFHALYSVAVPILFTHMLYTKASKEPWLSKKFMVILAIPLVIQTIALWKNPYSIAFIVVIGALALVAKTLPKNQIKPGKTRMNRALLGLGFYGLLIIASIVLAELKVNVLLFFAYIGIIWFLVYLAMRKSINDAVVFGLATYPGFAFFALLFLFGSNPLNAVAGFVIVSVFTIISIWKIRKK